MTPDERVADAIEYAHIARKALEEWSETADPVKQRKLQVLAAKAYRCAADKLDDERRLAD